MSMNSTPFSPDIALGGMSIDEVSLWVNREGPTQDVVTNVNYTISEPTFTKSNDGTAATVSASEEISVEDALAGGAPRARVRVAATGTFVMSDGVASGDGSARAVRVAAANALFMQIQSYMAVISGQTLARDYLRPPQIDGEKLVRMIEQSAQ